MQLSHIKIHVRQAAHGLYNKLKHAARGNVFRVPSCCMFRPVKNDGSFSSKKDTWSCAAAEDQVS